MNTEDLMLGDWVYLENGTNLEIVKITAIGGSTKKKSEIGLTVCIYGSSEYPTILFDCSKISPIPITPEILEKIGFKKSLQISDTPPYYQDEDGNIYYELTQKNKRVWGWWQPEPIKKFLIPANGLGWLELSYIHEIQHTLRLSGIIKNFKI